MTSRLVAKLTQLTKTYLPLCPVASLKGYNHSKCEIVSSSTIPPGLLISDFTHLQPSNSVLLCASLMGGAALDEALENSCSTLSTAASRLSCVSAHDAL